MDIDSQTQTCYAGEFRHSIDDKNRVTIPSRWRTGEGEEFILLPDAGQQFLNVMSADEFERMSAKVESSPDLSGRERRTLSRNLHSHAKHSPSDKQGRLLLPEDLCKEIGLKGEVALVGGRGRFEIWNLARRKEARQKEKATYQHVADLIGL